MNAITRTKDLMMEGAAPYSPIWYFERLNPRSNDRTDERSKLSIANPIECFLRELMQNILDCKSPTLRITFRRIHKDFLALLGFDELCRRVLGISLREAFAAEIDDDGYVNCLEIFDLGCGLGGNNRTASGATETPSAFQAYVRGFGNSSKGAGKSGSKGVGRSGILAISTMNFVFILTLPEPTVDEETGETTVHPLLAIGMANIDFHKFEGAEYKAGGLFGLEVKENGDDLIVPLEGEAAAELAAAVGVVREPGMPGMTQLLPSISDDITAVKLVAELVKNHFIPVLQEKVGIEIVDYDGTAYKVDASNIAELASNPDFGGSVEFAKQVELVRELLDLEASAVKLGESGKRLSEDSFDPEGLEAMRNSFASGKAVAVSVDYTTKRKRKSDRGTVTQNGSIHFACVSDPKAKGCDILIRDGIVKSLLRPDNCVSVTVSSGDAVAEMLRDGEDGSHADWAASRMKGCGWTGDVTGIVTHDFTRGAKALYSILIGATEGDDDTGLANVFGMPKADSRRRVKDHDVGGHVQPPEPEPDDPPFPPPPPPPPPPPGPEGHGAHFQAMPYAEGDGAFGTMVVLNENGREAFANGNTDYFLAFAYAVADKTVRFDQHSPADFDLAKLRLDTSGCTVEVIQSNLVKVTVTGPDCAFTVHGAFHADRMTSVYEVEIEAPAGKQD